MAGIAPDSLKFQLAHLDDDRSLGLKVTFILALILANVAVGLRVWSRRVSGVPLKADDYTIIGALVLWYGLSVINFLHAFRFGLGRHMAAVGADTMKQFLLGLYAYSFFYTPIIIMIKVSILLLYHRVFITPVFQWQVRFWIGFTVLFGLAAFLVDIFLCIPVDFFWDKSVGGRCIDTFRYYMACASINIFTDLVILMLPMPVIWQLQIPRSQKAVLVTIFLLGGMCCLATVFRLVTFPYIDNNDLSWTFVMCSYWTNSAEVPLAFICACIPTMRPLFRRLLPGSMLRGSRRRSSENSGGPAPVKRRWVRSARRGSESGNSDRDPINSAEMGTFTATRTSGVGGASSAWPEAVTPPDSPVPTQAIRVQPELDLS